MVGLAISPPFVLDLVSVSESLSGSAFAAAGFESGDCFSVEVLVLVVDWFVAFVVAGFDFDLVLSTDFPRFGAGAAGSAGAGRLRSSTMMMIGIQGRKRGEVEMMV